MKHSLERRDPVSQLIWHLLSAWFAFWFTLKSENGSSVAWKRAGTRAPVWEPGHILIRERQHRFAGLSYFSAPCPTQSKLILDAESRTSFILVKEKKQFHWVSASLGVLLPSLVWSKPSLSAVPPHPHLKKKPMKQLSHGPTSLSFHSFVPLHLISLIVPGSRKTEKTSVNSWISFKGREYRKINNWKFTFHESWDLPVTLAMSPITLIPKWPASETSRDGGC